MLLWMGGLLIFIQFFIWDFAWSQISFWIDYPVQGQRHEIQFSPTFLTQFNRDVPRRYTASPEKILQFWNSLSTQDQTSLQFLGQFDLARVSSESGRVVMNSTHLFSNQLQDLKFSLYVFLAEQIYNSLISNSSIHIRFLSRDMDELYFAIRLNLWAKRQSGLLSYQQYQNFIKRIKLIPFSRKMVGSLVQKKDPELLLEVLQVSREQMNQGLELVDLGFFGTIMLDLQPLFTEWGWDKVNFRFVWKAPSAPSQILQFELEPFYESIRQQYPQLFLEDLKKMVWPEPPNSSFRVGVIEHGPKILSGYGPPLEGKKIWIGLDVDNTILVDVPFSSSNESIQRIQYRPSLTSVKKYRDRLINPEPHKVIHFRFVDQDTIESAVILRTEFINFLRTQGKSKKFKLVLASANEDVRTEAILEQVQVDGRSLKEWGVTYIKSTEFIDGGKNISLFRKSLEIPSSDVVVFCDDLPNQVQLDTRSFPLDMVWPITEFSREWALGSSEELDLEDQGLWGDLGQALFQSYYAKSVAGNLERVRALSQQALLMQRFGLIKPSSTELKTPEVFNTFSEVTEEEMDQEEDPLAIFQLSTIEREEFQSVDKSVKLDQVAFWVDKIQSWEKTVAQVIDVKDGQTSENFKRLLLVIEADRPKMDSSQLQGLLRIGLNTQVPNKLSLALKVTEEPYLAMLKILPGLVSRRVFTGYDALVALQMIDKNVRVGSIYLNSLLQLEQKSHLIQYLLRDPLLHPRKSIKWFVERLHIAPRVLESKSLLDPGPPPDQLNRSLAKRRVASILNINGDKSGCDDLLKK